MALIKCPECGKEISDKADSCIYCGYPMASNIKSTTTSSFYPNTQPEPEEKTSGGSSNTSQETVQNPVQPENPNKGKDTAAFVLGICSLVCILVSSWLSLPCGIVGLVLGKEAEKGLGKAGRIMSIVGIAVSGVLIAVSLVGLSCLGCVGTSLYRY